MNEKKTWESLISWLEANAEILVEDIYDGATDEEIAAVEAELGVTLPEDMKAAYKVHDGQFDSGMGIVPAGMLLPLDGIVAQWDIWRELLDAGTFDTFKSKADDEIKPHWWNKKWIPFTYDGAGNHLCVDLDPEPVGKYGQVITMWHDSPERDVVADSFVEWMNDVVEELNSGVYEFIEDYGTFEEVE